MSAAPAPREIRDFVFTDADFRAIAEIAHREFGLNLQSAKKPLVASRLAKRLRGLGVQNVKAYLARLEDREELTALLSLLTTNVTHFFREQHHFTYLRERVLPPLLDHARRGGRVRLWSAGCSSGQEPYSIAMTVLGLYPNAADLDIRLLATDIDPVVVDRGRRGVYDREELAAIPREHHKYCMLNMRLGRQFRMADPVRRLVTFGVMNLVVDLPVKGPFDVIFCRNVAIYFDKATQQKVWASFGRVMGPSAHLFIGHSERISGSAASGMRSVGITIYEKAAGVQPRIG
ncbi:CheR family methyltransferase [Rhodovulum imhoffii]|nr:CheR family methyltransferase [Rhodovulum imhoffii]